MPGQRSRQGCDECRKRRRKCDEKKPECGHCTTHKRSCTYSIKLVWGGRSFQKSCFGQCLRPGGGKASATTTVGGGFVYGTRHSSPVPLELHKTSPIPDQLANGIAIPLRYRRLLKYFAEDILASLSTHQNIHQDLCEGLIPVMLASPHLLSAGLALAAAGLLSRGVMDLEGAETQRVMEHLQLSGLSLLRTSLASDYDNETYEVLLVTCLIWCLADVFSTQQNRASWRVHLHGVDAMLSKAPQIFGPDAIPGPTKRASRHLHQLYVSLQTLPYLHNQRTLRPITRTGRLGGAAYSNIRSSIDGFLGYDEELLQILQEADMLKTMVRDACQQSLEADILLGRLRGMMARDEVYPPVITISSLQPNATHDFSLCHKSFQHAILISLYRLQNHSSSSPEIVSAVETISEMVDNMTQGQPCHTWVAMSMPLFTIGCEAYSVTKQEFIRDKMQKLERCLGSLHVGIMRLALEDVWRIRVELGDEDGHLCATELIGKHFLVPFLISPLHASANLSANRKA